MESVKALSPAQCILLAATFAGEANIDSLHALTSSRPDLFDLELILRLLLSCLPEALEPSAYVPFLVRISRSDDSSPQDYAQLDISSVEQLSVAQARSKLKALHILQLQESSEGGDTKNDPLSAFLIRRAHRIDAETGLFPLIPKLLRHLLAHSAAIRDFYIGSVLPLLRLTHETPAEGTPQTLEDWEDLEGYRGVELILSQAVARSKTSNEQEQELGFGMRGVLAPWIFGRGSWAASRNSSKRRRLNDLDPQHTPGANGIELPPTNQSKDEWRATNEWIVSQARDHLPTAVHAVEAWDGPQDVDFGEEGDLAQYYELNEDENTILDRSYRQAAYAAVYAAESDDVETIDCAHSMLVRLADISGFEPPPDLATSVELLPKLEHHSEALRLAAMDFLQFDGLLRADNPLTVPTVETFALLQMLVYSAYLLSELGHPWSIVKVAKLRFFSDESEQMRLLQQIMDSLVTDRKQRSQQDWAYVRKTILWLWDWAINDRPDVPEDGYGIFGKIPVMALEKLILNSLCVVGQYDLVAQLYLFAEGQVLSRDQVEEVIIDLAMQYYDEASNGNRQRGSMKKASDLVTAFRSHFPGSPALESCKVLIGATHALSFYSLTLEQGVPFRPERIRRSEDPVGLLETVLEQNPRSYTELDNLIGISHSLVEAQRTNKTSDKSQVTDESQSSSTLIAERRVISMAIEAALREDDFETAYSYVVNRLSLPSTDAADRNTQTPDDYSWRAAYLAGRQRPRLSNPTLSGHSTSPQVRRLEQRMELLSKSLLLAPSNALPEVLNAWRKCEEELLNVLASETEAEDDFDDRADRQESNLPGTFGSVDQSFMIQPKRKELGRGATEEAPMGLFDVARGAAAAIERTARRQTSKPSTRPQTDADKLEASGAPGRQRKRDMLTSAVTGGMVSGIGWMLGAKPATEQDG